ncbi:MAG: hypothetical protein ACM3O4_01175 [Ignavibacteriales bacterium]
MKIVRNLTLMALGATLVIAYQKYNEPLMNAVGRAVKRSANRMNEELDDMM